MTNLREGEPADASPPEALSDQELDERLKDPDFMRQLDEFRPAKAARRASKVARGSCPGHEVCADDPGCLGQNAALRCR